MDMVAYVDLLRGQARVSYAYHTCLRRVGMFA